MAGGITSVSSASHSYRWAEIHASNMAGIGSVLLIRIQNTGETTGTNRMMSMSTTSIMDITYTTADIPTDPGSQSASRYNGLSVAASGRLQWR